ncbi:ankyrin repeat domain-containing protein [Ideonella oryzae]|uniref:Ankyrin repeat domain-containing protein n=1 Tax=Ideonella oryzae TaxID=2937441 RepID=A0ABT1BR14_9BURK|nr:ankyrin repeat domain-containing protein [Ideonella oryzae]MCO5977981.1 ankyrin repeat domain-containing protein [Ideonella oryzae]
MKRRRCLQGTAGLLLAATGLAARAASYEDWFRYIELDLGREIQKMLQAGFDVNTVDPKGQSGLYVALREGSATVVPVLLAWPGTALDAQNAMGETPLMMAALKGRMDVMASLIARGARINKDGWTPLHYAATGPNPDAVELLLAHGAVLDAVAPNGNTPLMMAAGYGAIDSARLLLRRGADARPRNKGGRDAADLAKAADRLGLAQELGDAAAAR